MPSAVGHLLRMRVQLGLLSPDAIEARSVVHCTEADDLYHAKMGPLTLADGPCGTCHQDATACPGHFGHIALCDPLYNVLYMQRILQTLRRVCEACGTLTHDAQRRRLAPTCATCGATVGTKARFHVTGDRLYDTSTKQDVAAEAARAMLARIDDKALPSLGWDARWSRPEWCIATMLPVAPPCCRPTAMSTRGICHDGLTAKYRELMRLNALMYALRRAPPHVRVDARQQAQWTLTTMLDAYETAGGDAARKRHRDERPFFSGLRQRLTGKEGRIRRHLMGKRVDQCARTVVSGDPSLELDEVGVPERIARCLTVPERVTPFNLERLRDCLRVGSGKLGGANYFQDRDGRHYDLSTFRVHVLRVGDVVERTLRDGDLVLMNRQPTLHKGSMMAHRVHVLPGKTFRINLSVTTPYNADFDGDELNLHVPQTLNARAEAEALLSVRHNVLSAQTNGTTLGLVQDALLGVYLLARKGVFVDRRDAQELLFAARPDEIPTLPPPAVLKPVARWTGKQIFSTLLPRDLTLYSRAHVVVDQGELLAGEVTKKVGNNDKSSTPIDSRWRHLPPHRCHRRESRGVHCRSLRLFRQ